ncbi:MAG: hypothetical protein GXP33_10870 [Spirochaetes bacterium]|nr:hypothetical protein [Spirochaetota bacterium]
MEEKVLSIIRSYALKSRRNAVPYSNLLKVAVRYADKKGDEELKNLVNAEKTKFMPVLLELEKKDRIKLHYENSSIDRIEIFSYYRDLLLRDYRAIDDDPSVAFPDRENYSDAIPEDRVLVINVKTDLVSILNNLHQLEKDIIQINFPEGINNLLVPADYIKGLMESAVLKIHAYLLDSRNSGFIYNKLLPIMKREEVILNEMLNTVVTKPRRSFSLLMNPTANSFKFWAHLASFILQDYKDKSEKLQDEIGYCQSAYLIGFFIVYQKGLVQRENEKKADLSNLESQLKKTPYAFTFHDLYNLRDNHGVQYIKKYSRDFIHRFLEEKSRRKEKERLPEIMGLKGSGGREYFIHRDLILPLFLAKAAEASDEIKTDILEQWVGLLRENRKTKEMKRDNEFSKLITGRVKSDFPLLTTLADPNLLYIAREEASVDYSILETVNRYFTRNKKLQPMNVILGLYRKDLVKEAKAALPFWITMPFIKEIIGFFKNLFTGKTGKGDREVSGRKKSIRSKAAERSSGKASPEKNIYSTGSRGTGLKTGENIRSSGFVSRADKVKSVRSSLNKVQYINAVKKLKEEVVGKDTTLNMRLKQLSGKWNPLFDPVAKKNLVEDVNALIRDFLRSLKRGFRVKPPDVPRLRNLAADLVKSRNLASIKKKDYLKEYIVVYMIKYLSEG